MTSSLKAFVIIFSAWLVTAAAMVFAMDRYDLHLLMNSMHSDMLDQVMMKLTYSGDGLFVVLVAIVLLFVQYRWALLVAISGILSGVLSQSLKRLVFSEVRRPIEHIEEMPDLYIIPMLDMKHMFSFPSGHSTAAFGLFFSLAVIWKRGGWGALCAVMAIIIGYTRIYLSQHFMQDVLAGSLLGLICGVIALFIVSRIKGEWTRASLRDLFGKKV